MRIDSQKPTNVWTYSLQPTGGKGTPGGISNHVPRHISISREEGHDRNKGFLCSAVVGKSRAAFHVMSTAPLIVELHRMYSITVDASPSA